MTIYKGRPIPSSLSSCCERGSMEYRWTKGFVAKEVPRAKEKEINGLDDDAVIRLARRGLGREAKESPDEDWRGFVGKIIRTLKDEDEWPAFAKSCREDHQSWLLWCMEALGDDDGNNVGED